MIRERPGCGISAGLISPVPRFWESPMGRRTLLGFLRSSCAIRSRSVLSAIADHGGNPLNAMDRSYMTGSLLSGSDGLQFRISRSKSRPHSKILSSRNLPILGNANPSTHGSKPSRRMVTTSSHWMSLTIRACESNGGTAFGLCIGSLQWSAPIEGNLRLESLDMTNTSCITTWCSGL